MNSKRYYLTTLGISTLCLVLALMITLGLQVGSVEDILADARREVMGTIPDMSLNLASPERPQSRAFVERPLFTEDRRPPVIAVETVKQQPAKAAAPVNRPEWLLTGTVVTNGSRHALVMEIRSNEIQRLAQGDKLNGWEVIEIEKDRVTVSNGSQQHSYELEIPRVR